VKKSGSTERNTKTVLTPTGLLMEGVRSFQKGVARSFAAEEPLIQKIRAASPSAL